MHRYLQDFHEDKDIFVEFRAYKKANAQVIKIGSLMPVEIADFDVPSKQGVIMAIQNQDQAKAAEIDMLKE